MYQTGESPLYFACLHNHLAVALLLLQSGALPNTAVKDRPTSGTRLDSNASKADTLCTACSEKISNTKSGGDTPLCAASKHGNVELVAALLVNGADIGLRTEVCHFSFLTF